MQVLAEVVDDKYRVFVYVWWMTNKYWMKYMSGTYWDTQDNTDHPVLQDIYTLSLDIV